MYNLCLWYSYQPAPFFVLDEIDAALDNTNINRVSWCGCCTQVLHVMCLKALCEYSRSSSLTISLFCILSIFHVLETETDPFSWWLGPQSLGVIGYYVKCVLYVRKVKLLVAMSCCRWQTTFTSRLLTTSSV